jgi:hypothetical protein
MIEEIQALLSKWEEDLERLRWTPYVAKGMDAQTSMGVQHGRVTCLKHCIDQLKTCVEKAKSDQGHQ